MPKLLLLLLVLSGGFTMAQNTSEATFPNVSGNNLNKLSFNLPKDFEADYNLIFLAFLQEHQEDVNTWLGFADELESNYSELRYYELPTLTKTNGLFSDFIDGGMRSGILDTEVRARTITLYIDRKAFLSSLGISATNTIYTLLVKRNGDVLWLTPGRFNEEKAAALESVLRPLINTN